MVPIALDPDFESLAETLTSLSLELDDSNPLDSFLREAAQAASLAAKQPFAEQRRQSQSAPQYQRHRSFQEVVITSSQQQLPTNTVQTLPIDASCSSTPSSTMMDISPISPNTPTQHSRLSHAQSAHMRIQTLKSSPSQQSLLNNLPTCLQKRQREVDYTSTFRFVKLWFRDGHWSDNLEPTWHKNAPKMPNIPKLIASLRRRKSDATMLSSSCSNSTISEGSESDTETESERRIGYGSRVRTRNRDREREMDRESEHAPIYLTPQKGKQPKTYRSSSNLYELPAGVAPEKSPLAYTPSNLGASRLRSLATEEDEEDVPVELAVPREDGDDEDGTFTVPKLRKRPGAGKLGDRGGVASGRNSPSPLGIGGGAQGTQRSGGLPFWMPMGHTNGPSLGVGH